MAQVTRKPPCCAPGCWTPARQRLGPVALCAQHLGDVRESLGLARIEGSPAPLPPVPPCTSVVYYVSLDGGQTVKIGTTTSPRTRFSALTKRATGVFSVLVASPGSYKEERAAHRRFQHLSTGIGEFFWLKPELREHVAKVRATWPQWEQIVAMLDERKNESLPGLKRRNVRPSGWYEGVERRFS